jgi:hypothetical protein
MDNMKVEQVKEDMDKIKRYAGNRVDVTIREGYYKCVTDFKECTVEFLASYNRAEFPYGITIRPKNEELAQEIVKTLTNI